MNANNFDTTRLLSKYPDIEKYLQHDCLGLLEVVGGEAVELSWAWHDRQMGERGHESRVWLAVRDNGAG